MSKRRAFLKTSGLLAGAALAAPGVLSAQTNKRYKAAVIGRTGGGDYGHSLDTIFNGFENITVLAVADHDPAGRSKAQERSGAQRGYTDYREMLEKEKPDLVSIAPRQPDCHREMALAAIEAGAHIYMEKPFTETPAEADDIIDAAKKHGTKICVAHTRRYQDQNLLIQKLIREGYFGDVLEIRFQGKQDSRVGGEDLYVLGSHDMDLMRLFLSDPLWCFASVTQEGRDITAKDIRKGNEPYTVAGDTIRADYQFSGNVQCKWNSIAAPDWNRNIERGGKSVNKWGFDLFGTKRALFYQENLGAFVLDYPLIAPIGIDAEWKPIEEAAQIDKPAHLSHPIRDLIHAIETDSKPHCNDEDARWAVEMCCAVYHSQKAKCRIPFPLQNREHPLKKVG